MADYYTNFSFILPLPTEAAQQEALDLADQALYSQLGDESLPDDFPEALREVIEDWYFETAADDRSDGWGLWLHSNCGGIDAACAFIQHLLQRFDPDAHVQIEWSNDCTKPLTDAYGGGAALITSTEIRMITTREWLEQEVATLTETNRAGATAGAN